MKNLCLIPLILCLLGACAAVTAAPEDLVPRGSGLYDALALLAQEHLLAPGAPDVTDLQGVAGRLYTRAEFARMVQEIVSEPSEPRAAAALAFARNVLAPELRGHFLAEAPPPPSTTLGVTGFLEPEVGGRNNDGSNLHEYGEIYGRGRLLGSLGRDGAYTVSLTNIYRQTRDHASFTTRSGGRGGADNPDALDGVDEAYATVLGHHGLRGTIGYLRQRWGSGYQGDMLVSDNAPAHFTLEVEFPFSLGATLGTYRFTEYEQVYNNAGRQVYQGGRRLEHPIGDRVTASVEEAYTSSRFDRPQILVLPYYAYQRFYYNHNVEPLFFNYLLNLGLTVRPDGPAGNSRVYGQFLVDDFHAPRGIGLSGNTPRKIGYLVGYAQLFPASGTDFVVEYARTDRETYTKQPPELAWFSGNLPMGYPIGPNGRELFVRLGQRLGRNWNLAVEARDRRRVSDDFPAPTSRSLDLALAYHLRASQSIGLRYADYREDPFTGTSPATPANFGGAAYGERLRRHILALSFLQAF